MPLNKENETLYIANTYKTANTFKIANAYII